MRKAAILILVFLLASPMLVFSRPIQENEVIQKQASMTTTIDAYGEFANFYVGKNLSMAMVVTCIGGHIEVPIDPTWPELNYLQLLRIAGGVGHRWWLYYHHDIYPEIPPITTLIMVYGSTLTESQAISQAKGLAQKISDAIGMDFYPLWSFRDDEGRTIILFTSEAGAPETVDFIRNQILPKFPDEGFGKFVDSPVVNDNLDRGIYTRAALTLIRDFPDVDNDTDTTEFVPVLVLATVIKDAIEETGDGWYRFSVKDALGLPNITIAPKADSNISIVKISHYLPLEIDENRTSPLPDNPMYEYSGKLIYILRAPNRDISYDDIVVYGKILDFEEELAQMPVITAMFTLAEKEEYEINFYGESALNITYKVILHNFGNGTAYNVRVGFEISRGLRRMLDETIQYFSYAGVSITYDDLLNGAGWRFDTINVDGVHKLVFVNDIGTLGSNQTVNVSFNLIVVWSAVGIMPVIEALNPHIGPLIFYEDSEGKPYFTFANGFSIIPERIALVALLIPQEPEPVPGHEEEMLFEFKAQLWLIGFGNETIHNVRAHLFINKPEGPFELGEIREVDFDYRNQITPVNNTILYVFNFSFEARIRSGIWFMFGAIEFDVEGITESIGFATNSYMFRIPPMPWLIERWIRQHVFPYPHVELDVDKAAAFDNTTSELTIRLNITNIGDTNTTIKLYEFLLLDYVDTSAGNNGVLYVKVNGSDISYNVIVNEDLGVLVIETSAIDVNVNTTITVEIKVKISVNYTGEFVIRPTLIKYIFGEFAPDRIEDEEACASEAGSRSKGRHEIGEGEHGGKFRILADESLHVMQGGEATPLSTYTNAVVITVSAPTKPSRRIPWGFIILLTLIISIVVVVYIVMSKRSS